LGEALRLEQGLGGLAVLSGVYLIHRSRGMADAPGAVPGD
jgi:drug/metabolite transporter (DMT)-like permease